MFTNFDVRREDTINKDGKTVKMLSKTERNTFLFVSSKLCLARYRDLSFT